MVDPQSRRGRVRLHGGQCIGHRIAIQPCRGFRQHPLIALHLVNKSVGIGTGKAGLGLAGDGFGVRGRWTCGRLDKTPLGSAHGDATAAHAGHGAGGGGLPGALEVVAHGGPEAAHGVSGPLGKGHAPLHGAGGEVDQLVEDDRGAIVPHGDDGAAGGVEVGEGSGGGRGGRGGDLGTWGLGDLGKSASGSEPLLQLKKLIAKFSLFGGSRK